MQNHDRAKWHRHSQSIPNPLRQVRRQSVPRNSEIPHGSSSHHAIHKNACRYAASYSLHLAEPYPPIMYPHNRTVPVPLPWSRFPAALFPPALLPYAQYSSDILQKDLFSYPQSKLPSVLLPLPSSFPRHNISPAYNALRFPDMHSIFRRAFPFPASPAYNNPLPAHTLHACKVHRPSSQVPYCNGNRVFHPIQRYGAHAPDIAVLPHTWWMPLCHLPAVHLRPWRHRLRAAAIPVPDCTGSLPAPSMHSAVDLRPQVPVGMSLLPSSARHFPGRQTPSYYRVSRTGNLPQKASPGKVPPHVQTNSVLSYNSQRYDTHLPHLTGSLHILPCLPYPSLQVYLQYLHNTEVPLHSGSYPCITPSFHSAEKVPMHNPAHPSPLQYWSSETPLYLPENVFQTYCHNPSIPD